MDTKPILPPEHDISIHVDFLLLRDILRRKAALVAAVGLLAAGAYAGNQLYRVPQMYMGEVSIAMQQSNTGVNVSGLSALLGNSGGSHKYIGLLASRMMAENVEKRVHLKDRMHLGSEKEAVGWLRGGLHPDDGSYEGLLILRYTMEGPPARDPDPTHKRDRVRQAVADCANAYAKSLSEFYSNSNSESANALLKIAEDERIEARTNYQAATNRLRNFVLGWKNLPVRGTPVGGNIESNSPDYLLSLYNQIDQIDTDIRATHVGQEAQTRLREGQIKEMGNLPAEDNLLNSARNAVKQAELNMKQAEDTYGPDHPQYLEAQDHLKRTREELVRQSKGMKQLHTSDQVEQNKQLEVLQFRRKRLEQEIAAAETNLTSRRDLAWRLEQLRTEQNIALQRMQSAEVKATEIRLTTLTGKSRISILDEALPPDDSMSPPANVPRMSLLLGIFAAGLFTVAEYLRQLRRRSLSALNFAVSVADIVEDKVPQKTEKPATNGDRNGEKNGGKSPKAEPLKNR